METENIVPTIIIIVAVGLVLGIGIFTLSNLQSNAFNNSVSLTNSTVILIGNSTTISPIGTGISSFSVQTYNNTWLNCTTNDVVSLNVTETKATLSIWFKNSTTDWTSIIKSGANTYVDGALNNSWAFYPYYINGTMIYLCKTDASTFLTVSIDEFRVYEVALNSTEVLEVYNEGR